MPDRLLHFHLKRGLKKIEIEGRSSRGSTGNANPAPHLCKWQMMISHRPPRQQSRFLLCLFSDKGKKKPHLSPPVWVCEAEAMVRQRALHIFDGSSPRILPSQLLREVGTLMIQWWKKPNSLKRCCSALLSHPILLQRLIISCLEPYSISFTRCKMPFVASFPAHAAGTSKVWMSSALSRWKYHQDCWT